MFGIVWSAIKGEYRAYVSGGEHAQIVTVGFGDRMAKLGELVSALDREALADGADRLVKRITYVEFFGAVLLYVPAVAPHEDGAIWWDAIIRPFMPRLFFPDKGIIDDSERTNKYTGLGVSGSDVGTSISIGYFGEAYIDFGAVRHDGADLSFRCFLWWSLSLADLHVSHAWGNRIWPCKCRFVGWFIRRNQYHQIHGRFYSVFAGCVVDREICGAKIFPLVAGLIS